MTTIALVTGSSSGLGIEIAKQFNQKGVKVVVTGRNASKLEQALQQLNNIDKDSIFCGDLTDATYLAEFLTELIKRKLIPEIIIHNLGGVVIGDQAPLSAEVLSRSMRLNLEVAVEINRYFLPHMIKNKRGRIIHISSDASLTGKSAPGYAAAKAAVNAYVKSTARFYAKDNVMICAVLPGIFEHEGSVWAEKKKTHPEQYYKKLDQMPLGRFGSPQDIADIVVDIACNNNMMCAGSLIELAGGN